ncbi:MAG: MarR family winged helix-turn-helix transcriptional regulator [Candidatus Shapirobacteria bacterium]
MNNTNTKLLSEFLSKAVKVRRLIEQTSSFEDKAITLLQVQALTYIKAHPKTPVGLLANELSMSLSAVAQLTNRLADVHYIQREDDATDRRIICLSITQEGTRQMKVFKKQLENNHFKVLSAIPENDLKELVRIFTNILDAQNQK